MRFAAVVLLAFAAPAFAQEAPANSPPPEGFYRDIPNAYDLLMRMRPVLQPGPIKYDRDVDFCLKFGPRVGMTDPEKKAAKEARQACLVAAWKANPALGAFIRSLAEKGELDQLLPPLE